jgi:hypothetical protein
MGSFSIPWPCLDLCSNKPSEENTKPKAPISFSQAVNNVCEIPLSQLPQACVKGDRLAIAIPEKDYVAGMEKCKHNLHGRIIWPKGSTPLSVVAVKNKLAPLWKDLSKWGVISLGKGYYEFVFSSLEDVRRVRSVASWSLNPGMLKLFAWTKDFNPRTQQNCSAQVWVRLYGLSQEYWSPNILFAIASSVGTPICTDSVTAKPLIERTFGQFVRVLVDMDLTQTIRYKVLVERQGFAFFVDLDYENLPDFCTNCKFIGHHLRNCKKVQLINDEPIATNQGNLRKQPKEAKKVYVQAKNSRIEQNNPKILENRVENTVNVESDDDIVEERPIVELEQFQVQVLKTPPIILSHSTTNSQEQVVSSNKFAALGDLDNDDDQGLEDEQVPKIMKSTEVNEMTPNTQNTDLVKDTSECEESLQTFDQASGSKIIQDNNEFLKQSWANMVEEDDEIEVSDNPKQPPFTMVQSKAGKKEHAKKPLTPNKPYGTRSRVGAPKPFK